MICFSAFIMIILKISGPKEWMAIEEQQIKLGPGRP